jgi:hypothetical protein
MPRHPCGREGVDQGSPTSGPRRPRSKQASKRGWWTLAACRMRWSDRPRWASGRTARPWSAQRHGHAHGMATGLANSIPLGHRCRKPARAATVSGSAARRASATSARCEHRAFGCGLSLLEAIGPGARPGAGPERRSAPTRRIGERRWGLPSRARRLPSTRRGEGLPGFQGELMKGLKTLIRFPAGMVACCLLLAACCLLLAA